MRAGGWGVAGVCSAGDRGRLLQVHGGVVGGVVDPAAPEDAGPACAEAAQRAVVKLAAGSGLLVGVAGPVVLPDTDERPPVDGVAHPLVRGVAETHGLAAPRRA